ncbi:MAG: hypothetical protein WDO13_07910 [Verrucomicrobiota bacterium]
MSLSVNREEFDAPNRFFTDLIQRRGGRDVFTHLPGDISLLDDLLFVALPGEPPPHTERPSERRELRLPSPWHDVVRLTERFTGAVIERRDDGTFVHLKPGIYQMERA